MLKKKKKKQQQLRRSIYIPKSVHGIDAYTRQKSGKEFLET